MSKSLSIRNWAGSVLGMLVAGSILTVSISKVTEGLTPVVIEIPRYDLSWMDRISSRSMKVSPEWQPAIQARKDAIRLSQSLPAQPTRRSTQSSKVKTKAVPLVALKPKPRVTTKNQARPQATMSIQSKTLNIHVVRLSTQLQAAVLVRPTPLSIAQAEAKESVEKPVAVPQKRLKLNQKAPVSHPVPVPKVTLLTTQVSPLPREDLQPIETLVESPSKVSIQSGPTLLPAALPITQLGSGFIEETPEPLDLSGIIAERAIRVSKEAKKKALESEPEPGDSLAGMIIHSPDASPPGEKDEYSKRSEGQVAILSTQSSDLEKLREGEYPLTMQEWIPKEELDKLPSVSTHAGDEKSPVASHAGAATITHQVPQSIIEIKKPGTNARRVVRLPRPSSNKPLAPSSDSGAPTPSAQAAGGFSQMRQTVLPDLVEGPNEENVNLQNADPAPKPSRGSESKQLSSTGFLDQAELLKGLWSLTESNDSESLVEVADSPLPEYVALGNRASGLVEVQPHSFELISSEGAAGASPFYWQKILAEDYLPTVVFRERGSRGKTIRLISENTVGLLPFMGHRQSETLGIIYGALTPGWTASVPSYNEGGATILYFDEAMDLIPTGEREPFESVTNQAKYFIALNVPPGPHLVSAGPQEGLTTQNARFRSGAVAIPVLKGAATFVDLSTPYEVDFRGYVLGTEVEDGEENPGMSGVQVEVVGQPEATARTTQDGYFSIPGVTVFSDYSVYVDLDQADGYRRRHRVRRAEMDRTLLHFLELDVLEQYRSQIGGGMSSASGLIYCDLFGLLDFDPESRYYPSVRPMVENATLQPSSSAIDIENRLLYQNPVFETQTRFLSVQVPEGLSQVVVEDLNQKAIWSELVIAQPGVINMIEAH